MCGIAGYIGRGDTKTLERMGQAIKYRGPDDRGFFADDGVGLEFRRLSIIDLASGNQPMYGEDANIVSVFNGEIYNFKELRQGLSGHKFKSSGDSEVIPHLYEEVGEKIFEKIHGMFAIAIWDKNDKKLILARDRFGKKPLYYYKHQNGLVFGSEIKALLVHPDVKKEIDNEALSLYLSHEYIPAPYSIFKGIKKVLPGHFLVYENGELKENKYYELKFNEREINEHQALEEFEILLKDAINKRLVSDVPIGAYLSGGLDSSLISFYAAKALKAPLETFSIASSDPRYDESPYAREVASLIGSNHHEKILDVKDLPNLVLELGALIDEPIADPAIFTNYYLSKFAKERVTVALGGDAGDELFFGYQTFQAERLLQFFSRVPRSLSDSLAFIINKLPTSFEHISFDYKLKRFFEGLNQKNELRNLHWIGAFSEQRKEKVLSKYFQRTIDNFDSSSWLYKKHAELGGDKNPWHHLAFEYQSTYMIDDILMVKDRASMYASLELRSPFLDTNIVEFANSLPVSLKLRGFTTKYLLRKLMKDKLPKSVLKRKKQGFSMPLGKWFRGNLKSEMDRTFERKRIEKQGIFNYEEIKKIMAEHNHGVKNNRKEIWTLLMFELWYENWMK